MNDIVTENNALLTDDGPKPVTVSLKQTIKTEHLDAYVEWQNGILNANKIMPGFVGATIVTETGDDACNYIVFIRYESVLAAQAWNTSELRAIWISKLRAITGESTTGQAQVAFDEYPSFTDIFNTKEKKQSRWKTFGENRRVWLLIFLQVFGLVELYTFLIPVVFGEHWTSLHFHAQMALSVMATTLTMDLVTIPIIFGLSMRCGFISRPKP